MSLDALSAVRKAFDQRLPVWGLPAWAEFAVKYSRECVVAKAAIVGDLADRPAHVHRRPPMQETRGVVEFDELMKCVQVVPRAVKNF